MLSQWQQPYPRGDDRERTTRARQAAEALFTPKRQITEQSVSDSLPSADQSARKPRVLAISSTGAKALSKAIRKTFGRHTPIQRCQVHKARNITERLAKPLHASVRKALRQAWELDDAEKAEKLIRNLARRLEREAPGVSASILEGIDEILTVTRLGLPVELRRSLACTNIIENMNGTIRQVCRNVKRWQDAKMALRWTGAAMLEAAKGFRRLKPTGNYRSCAAPWPPIKPNTSATLNLNSKPRPRSLVNQ